MTYYTVQQIVDIALDRTRRNVASLPESIKRMLSELESCLEITDNAAEPATRTYHHPASSSADSGEGARRYKRDGRFAGPSLNAAHSKHRKDHSRNGGGGGLNDDWNEVRPKGLIRSSAAANDADWETMRSFKSTKIESKTGIEKTVNDIRIALNKMSAANYEKQKNAVLGFVGSVADSSEEDIRRISKAIFDITSTNKFYSEIYANMYKELIGVNGAFRKLLDEFVDGFTNMDSAPVYVDPDQDYDGFCVYSKACDVRKSTSTFLVNCLKIELVDPGQIVAILSRFMEYVDANKRSDGFAKFIEEVIENVYIIASLCADELSKTADWNNIVLPTLKRLVAEKNEGHASLSSRATFKCMDLLEKILV